MSSPDELREEAERLDREAHHKDELAAQLRSQAGLLPGGIELAKGWIDDAVWESPVAYEARGMLIQQANAVCAGASDLARVARELERAADDLRDEARGFRREADTLEVGLAGLTSW